MVTRIRPALGAGLVATIALAVAAPVSGAFEAVEPNPLKTASTIRLADVAAAGDAVAVGWREGPNPGTLFVALSLNRGASYERENGNLRSFPVAGIGRLGLAVDICGGSLWVASAARATGDTAGESDVLLLRRGLTSGASQSFMTMPSAARKTRVVDVACVGNRLLAIAWIDTIGGATRARLLLRDIASLTPTAASGRAGGRVAPAATNSLHNLGAANAADGISVAATGNRVLVSWSKGGRRDLQVKRFSIGSGADPTITPRPTQRIAVRDAGRPKLATRGRKAILAYSDDGKLKVRISDDAGASFGPAAVLLAPGSVRVPSFATSAAMSGRRIVIAAMKKQPNSDDRDYRSVRIQSQNLGVGWSESAEFGNRGPRMAALRKVNNSVSRINEAWHDDGASIDVLRAQREVAG